jgi:hypothetical protein
VFWFSLRLLSKTFLILRIAQRGIITNVYWSSCSVPVILVRYEWILSFLTNLRKMLHIKFHEIPSSGSRIISYEQTDKHKKSNSRSKTILLTGLKILILKNVAYWLKNYARENELVNIISAKTCATARLSELFRI